MKFVRLAAVVVATALGVQTPAHAGLLTLTSGPGNASVNTTNTTYGFGGNGVGSGTNPTANYYVNGVLGGHLNNAPVAILFVFGPNGQISTYTGVNVGTYDNVEDTQIGVLNLSGAALTSFKLTGAAGSDLFGFDGDGISQGTTGGSAQGAGAPGNASDPSGYGGPLVYYTLNNPGAAGTKIGSGGSNSLTAYVNFIGSGLADGSSTYFSLEGTPSTLGNIGVTSTTPEPASLTMLGLGVLGLAGYGWRRKTTAKPMTVVS